VEANVQLAGATQVGGTAQVITLAGNALDENTFEHPDTVVPKKATIGGVRPEFRQVFGPRSFTVLRIVAK
jgi:alpha-L-arabinofuranosidase